MSEFDFLLTSSTATGAFAADTYGPAEIGGQLLPPSAWVPFWPWQTSLDCRLPRFRLALPQMVVLSAFRSWGVIWTIGECFPCLR